MTDDSDQLHVSVEEYERRVKVLSRARHSTEMEGGRTSDAVRAVQDRWARGEITADEVGTLSAEISLDEVEALRRHRGASTGE